MKIENKEEKGRKEKMELKGREEWQVGRRYNFSHKFICLIDNQ